MIMFIFFWPVKVSFGAAKTDDKSTQNGSSSVHHENVHACVSIINTSLSVSHNTVDL